jgi:hypothetical protein
MNIKEMSTPFYALGLAALMLAYAAQYKKTETRFRRSPSTAKPRKATCASCRMRRPILHNKLGQACRWLFQ